MPPSAEAQPEKRATETSDTLGDLRIRASLRELKDPATRRAIEKSLAEVAAVEVSDVNPDVIVTQERSSGPGVEVRIADTGLRILGPLPLDPARLGDPIANRLQDYARNRYLRGLTISNPKLAASLEVVPVRLLFCSDESQPTEDTCQLVRMKSEEFVSSGRQLEAPIGTHFKLRVHGAPIEAYVAVLDLAPDGRIEILWPPRGRKERVAAGVASTLDALWRFAEPPGLEVLMLVATETWVDFEAFRTVPSLKSRRPARGDLGAFAPLFDGLAIRTHADTVVSASAFGTSFVHVLVTRGTK